MSNEITQIKSKACCHTCMEKCLKHWSRRIFLPLVSIYVLAPFEPFNVIFWLLLIFLHKELTRPLFSIFEYK